jgi:hypothetical protein
MNQIKIAEGLAVNVTGLDGNYIIIKIDIVNDKITMHSMEKNIDEEHALSSVQMQLHASTATTMNPIQLEVILGDIESRKPLNTKYRY